MAAKPLLLGIMAELTCRQCGADLVPQTNFCRKCGVAISTSAELLDGEQPTALFNETDIVATQRLDPRPTAPEHSGFDVSSTQSKGGGAKRLVLIGVAVLLLLGVIASTVAVVKNRKRAGVASVEGVLYPGSHKTMDIVANGGGRAVSLETSESFEKVSQWYQTQLKPEKVVQLTERSVVMKGNNTTVTIIGDNDKTMVLLKITP